MRQRGAVQDCARILRNVVCTLSLVSEVLGISQMQRLGFIPYRSTAPSHRSLLPRDNLNCPTPSLFSKNRLHTSSSLNHGLFANKHDSREINSIAVVGGGLAGLSTVCSLLLKTSSTFRQVPKITVFDTDNPGCGGASAVAGGLLHPFSPTGKLVYLGKEGLEASNAMVERALKYEPKCVIRDSLYRIALDEKYKSKLQETAHLYPEYATWLEPSHIEKRCGTTTSLGGLVLTNGCRVIHVPTYLRGLWKACQDLSGGTATWCLENNNNPPPTAKSKWKSKLSEFDVVVLSAGSGLIEDSVLAETMENIPAMLVRGQSVEMSVKDYPAPPGYPHEAVLCGKYITPLPDGTNRVLIGATHEFGTEKLGVEEVISDLRKRSMDFLPHVWEYGHVDKITCGSRVQTQRGKYGRLPVVGQAQTGNVHENTWLFTGLSSRGLIHHSICGDVLSEAILNDDENEIALTHPELLWWKSKNKIK